MYTKSYGFETFMALKYLGIEMKIFEPQSGISELIAWIRRSCKVIALFGFQLKFPPEQVL